MTHFRTILKRVGFAWIGGVARGSSQTRPSWLGHSLVLGDKAVELARQKLGPGYKYSAQSISVGGGHTSAIVAAYNDTEIKHVSVESSE